MVEKEKPDKHQARVRQAFDAFSSTLGDRLDAGARESVDRVREAAEAGDGEKLRDHLNDLSRRHGWLYRELASHPEVATLLDELALLGL